MKKDNIVVGLRPGIKMPFIAVGVTPKFRFGTEEQIGYVIECVIPSASYDSIKVTIESDKAPLDAAEVAAHPVEVMFDGLVIIPYSLKESNKVDYTAKAVGVRRYTKQQ